ncbi:MAG: hypothetical protein M5U15_05215 [Kiritimatiellae bacterium]|nr:hypothetical protein [Kiritimatiellia bacterium]
MQKCSASVMWLVCLMVGLASTWSLATDEANLSAADEQAYQEAQAAWKRLVEVHEEAGIPPPPTHPSVKTLSNTPHNALRRRHKTPLSASRQKRDGNNA